MVRYEYYKPFTLREALDLMKLHGDAVYVAGGTDVMVLMKEKKLAPKALISLRNIDELSRKDGLTIGSGVTLREIQMDEGIGKHFQALHDAACRLGSTQIRNVATLGGNICNAAPSADTACPLLVFDAEVVIAGPGGERHLALDDFFVGPGKTVLQKGEILKGFTVEAFGDNTGSSYIKQTRRKGVDLPIIGVAARISLDRKDVRCKDVLCGAAPASEILAHFEEEELRCEDVRIAMGAAAPRPLRAKKAESALRGQLISDKAVAAAARIAASECSPIDDIRGEAWYRKEIVEVLVRRAVMKSIDRVLRPDETIYPDRLW